MKQIMGVVAFVCLATCAVAADKPAAVSDAGKLKSDIANEEAIRKLYDQYTGLILIHVMFQIGFCIFVLSNYMKTLSRELTEAALADGAAPATEGSP